MGGFAQEIEVGGLSGQIELFFGFTKGGEEQFDLPVQPLVGSVGKVFEQGHVNPGGGGVR